MNAIWTRFAVSILVAVGGGSSAAAQPADDVGMLIGTWRISGVGVAASPVQAVTPDDPALMGAILDITRHQISWRLPHRSTSLDVTCVRPRLVRGAILCRQGSFGPLGSSLTRRGGRLTLPWYDGAILRLTRVVQPRRAVALTADGFDTVRIGTPPGSSGYRLRGDGPSGSTCRSLSDPRVPGLEVITENGVVTVIKVRGFPVRSSVRTDRGIGIGSTEREVRATYSPLSETPHKYVDAPGKNLVWHESGRRNGLRFEIDTQRRVSAIHAGAEPSLMLAEGCS